MKKILLAFTLVMSLLACSTDSDNEDIVIGTSPITVECLTSNLIWYYSPDEGLDLVQQHEGVERYSFVRVGEKLSGSYKKDNQSENQYFEYTVSAPSVVLTFNDGAKKTLTVYKLEKSDAKGVKYIQINGQQFVGSMNGVDTETWK